MPMLYIKYISVFGYKIWCKSLKQNGQGNQWCQKKKTLTKQACLVTDWAGDTDNWAIWY